MEERPRLVYRPRGAALALFHSRADEILVEGPRNTGKTRAVLQKIDALARIYPQSRHLICRATRKSMSESVLVTFEDKVIRPEERASLGTASKDYRSAYDFYGNGSTIVVGGLDNADRFLSSEWDTVNVFQAEEITQDDWEKLTSSLRNKRLTRNGRPPYHQAIADSNPSFPGHWLNLRANAGHMLRLLSRHADNPTFTPEDQARLDRLTGVRKLRYRDGIWAGQEGLVYEDFDPAVHVVERFDVPAEWPRFVGADFGQRNATVVLWAARDPESRLYVYREVYETGRRASEMAPEVKRLSGDETIVSRWTDHQSEYVAEWEAQGVYTEPADKAVMAGIEAVQDALALQADGKPSLFLFRDLLVRRDERLKEAGKPCSVLEEFPSYVWDKTADGKPIKEQPKKIDDHGMDALRYLVMGVKAYHGTMPQFVAV